MSLRAYFAAIESGATAVARADLARELTPAELDALGRARLVKAGTPFTSWPCDQATSGCGREIVPDGGSAFLGVCEGSCEQEDRCLDVPLDAGALARAMLDLGALAAALRALYRLERAGPSRASRPAEPCAEPADEPACLGEERSPERTRDVFFAARPSAPVLAAFLEARLRVAREALVLVPTARAVPSEIAARHAPGARVEIEILEDAIAVRQGKLSRETRLRLVPPPADALAPNDAPEAPKAVRKPNAPPAPTGLAAQIGATKWSQIKITAIDGHTLRIQCGQTSVRRTYLDLGFGGANREPIEKWKIVIAICEGHGSFRWKQFGAFNAVKNSVYVVQRMLKHAFGLADNPIRPYDGALAWQAKFFASSEDMREEK